MNKVNRVVHLKKAIFSMFLILIMLIGIVNTVTVQARILEDKPVSYDKQYTAWELPRKIAIIFDNNNSIVARTALEVFISAKMVYTNIHLINVNDHNLTELILDQSYWIKIYFIEGNLEGFMLNGEIVSWNSIASTLLLSKMKSYHIFASGSTNSTVI